MAKWIRRGDSYKSEWRVFQYLEKHLPEEYVFYSNIVQTVSSGHSYEYDAILIGKHAVYVIEIKNWGGTIRCEADHWTMPGPFIPKDGNPLDKLDMKARVLQDKLYNDDLELRGVWVQPCLCLASPYRPVLDIWDEPERYKTVYWYRDLIPFLTERDRLTKPDELARNTLDIRRWHAKLLLSAGNMRPTPRREEKIGDYVVEGLAWQGKRYRALYGRVPHMYPGRYLLKIYPVPSSVKAAELEDFIARLRHDLSALNAVKHLGQHETGGHQHVAAGVNVFPHENGVEYVVVMEWVNGSLLVDEIKKISLLPWQKYQIAAQVCRGLACAHSAGVVHRNLTLQNIVLTPEGKAVIINFDYAKFVDKSIMPESMTGLTDYLDRCYQAPELLGPGNYHKASPITDVYSAARVIWELLTGSLPEPDHPLSAAEPGVDGMDPEASALLETMGAVHPAIRARLSLIDAAITFELLAEQEKQAAAA